MNTMAWLAAFVASLWAFWYLTSEQSQAVLGFVFVPIAGVCFVLAIFAIEDDIAVFRGRNDDD